ncbi:hypothetical protein PACTADRAFT_52016 [Pachysolen tannophilus NRRL Y-2460]|uniref:N-acetyltransferase domain-containing protein n=1 Tax=Pachysolen tannophilus NRRL Y-2460 TaxID=669874 RepID=A0A1E4TNT2_PACTA|nr:hypothetical protein PACTADRAFT_52016 [Pachysolen tannophilus NRRL Y-2460]
MSSDDVDDHNGRVIKVHKDNDIIYTTFEFVPGGSKSRIEEVNNDLLHIMKLVNEHLSEPYSIYVYRFFLNNWPKLCHIARLKSNNEIIGVIISKSEPHRNTRIRGYLGMLAINPTYRSNGIAKRLIEMNINNMIKFYKVDEIILEAEVINKTALSLYENFGFIRVKRLFRYYLNTHDAYRLILPITEKSCIRSTFLEQLDPNQLEDYI